MVSTFACGSPRSSREPAAHRVSRKHCRIVCAMTLAPGTKIGSYEIAGAIGAGGMGEVYRARDVRLARDVAIKVLPPAFAADPDRLARFEREARTLAALNHPNIAQVHGVTDSPIALVM